MVIFVYARIVIFLGLVVHVISAEECFPVFNEISSLGFATIASTQFLELFLSQGCSDNDASRNLNLNDYGILVLETKSIWVGKPDDFALISFVDFNNQRWSRDSRHRLEEFFVVGSSKDGTIRMDFTFHDINQKTAKCSRFVNWPNCNRPGVQPCDKSITRFFSKLSQPPSNERGFQTIFLLVYLRTNEDRNYFVSKFSFVKTSESGHPTYNAEKIPVSPSSQRWLSSRIKNFVVFVPSEERSSMLPLQRMNTLLSTLPPSFVTPKTLAKQWLNPLPGLGLSPHMPSTFKSSDSFMKHVEESIISGAAQDLVKLSAQPSMILQKLNSRPDAHVIRLSKEDHETAKAMIFSSGALRDDHNIDRDIP